MRTKIDSALELSSLSVPVLFFLLLGQWFGICDFQTMAWSTALGVQLPVSIVLTILPVLWAYQLQHSFFTEGSVATEIGMVLHLLYFLFSFTCCLRYGVDIGVGMFCLYWPAAAIVKHVLDPLFMRLTNGPD